ncbi:unnamed protein product [Cochlearia groenlandica]
MIKKLHQKEVRMEKIEATDLTQSPAGDYVKFISPDVYRFNRQKYLRSYTFKSYDDHEENLPSKKQQIKWFMKKNKKKKKKKTSHSLRNSLKTCLKLFFSCFHV